MIVLLLFPIPFSGKLWWISLILVILSFVFRAIFGALGTLPAWIIAAVNMSRSEAKAWAIVFFIIFAIWIIRLILQLIAQKRETV